MTAIATFCVTDVPFLVADTLETHLAPSCPASPWWVSTGVRVEGVDFREGILKIWPIQDNLALACAGHAATGDALLIVLLERAQSRPFDDLVALQAFLTESAVPSIAPLRGQVELCGFLGDSGRSPALHVTVSPGGAVVSTVSEQFGMRFTEGSGGHLFRGILERIRSDVPVHADTLLGMFETQFYIRQFIDPGSIMDARSGGAILGLYWTPDGFGWSRPRTIVALKNIGGTGRSAKFVPLPIVYRIWGEAGRFCTSSVFEQDGRWYQRLTSCGNQVIPPVLIILDNLPPEACSFNTSRVTCILLPDQNDAFPATLESAGEAAFDEQHAGGRLTAWKFQPEWSQQLGERFWVKADQTIAILGEAYRARASELASALATNALSAEDRLSLLVDLAHIFRRLASTYQYAPALQDAVRAWLKAVRLCDEELPHRRADAVHGLEVYLEELAENAPDHLETALNDLGGQIEDVAAKVPDACSRAASGRWAVRAGDNKGSD